MTVCIMFLIHDINTLVLLDLFTILNDPVRLASDKNVFKFLVHS